MPAQKKKAVIGQVVGNPTVDQAFLDGYKRGVADGSQSAFAHTTSATAVSFAPSPPLQAAAASQVSVASEIAEEATRRVNVLRSRIQSVADDALGALNEKDGGLAANPTVNGRIPQLHNLLQVLHYAITALEQQVDRLTAL